MRRSKTAPRTQRKKAASAPKKSLSGCNLLSLQELTAAQITHLLKLAAQVKAQPKKFRRALEGKTLALLFEKPSLRTRATFQIGM